MNIWYLTFWFERYLIFVLHDEGSFCIGNIFNLLPFCSPVLEPDLYLEYKIITCIVYNDVCLSVCLFICVSEPKDLVTDMVLLYRVASHRSW